MPDSSRRSVSRRAFLKALTGLPSSGAAEFLPVGQITYDAPRITRVGRFFRQVYRPSSAPPQLDLDTWTLTVSGMVERPLVLAYEDVRAFPAVGETCTLVCIGNPPGGDQIGNAVWRGFDLDVLLAQAGVLPSATHIRFESADGYTTSVPLARAVNCGVLMAYEMNGALLPRAHGFPLRALVPGLYGTKSPKWLTRITLIDHAHPGYWESQPHGWSDEAVIRTHARIDSPLPYTQVRIGAAVVFQGIAFAGDRRITAVEVNIDGGGWMPVTLRPPESPRAWTQWYTLWTPDMPGMVTVSVRATDETGFTQTRQAGHLSDAYPDGSDAIHSITLHVLPS